MANRYALIYLPGLQIRNRGQSVDIISRWIASALNYLHLNTEYIIEESKDEVYGAEDQISSVRRIRSKGKSAKETWQLDIYELDYQALMASASDSNKKLSQFRAITVTLWFALGRVFGLLFKKGKSTVEKLRMISGGVVLVALAVYLFPIIPTFIGTLHQYLHSYMGLPETSWLSLSLHWLETKTEALHAFYVGSLTVGLFSNRRVQNHLRRYTLEMVQVIRYFNHRGGGSRPAQQLLDLLRYLKAKGSRYKRIDLLAYSFGNIVAMDALFTTDVKPSELVKVVHNMVGIGNPYDVVRTFWPRYFVGRHSHSAAPKRWINIYSPRDLLSSNFRNDSQEIEPEQGLVPGANLEGGEDLVGPENIIFPAADSLKGVPFWQIPFKVRVDTHSKFLSGSSGGRNQCFIRVAELLYS